MRSLIFQLCDERHVYTENPEEFKKECTSLGINPEGGIVFLPDDPANPQPGKHLQEFHLDSPITKEEGRVIADHFHLAGEYDELIANGISPFDALVEWDLI